MFKTKVALHYHRPPQSTLDTLAHFSQHGGPMEPIAVIMKPP